MEGVDRQEKFKQEAFTLRTMRLDYELFNQQLGILGDEESEVFQQFIRGEKDLQTIALFRETYHSVTSRFFSNNTCWKLIFAIHFISLLYHHALSCIMKVSKDRRRQCNEENTH